MLETLGSINDSPSQKPILKPSSYDVDTSPTSFKQNYNHQNSLQTSFLDSTQHASFLPPSEPPSKVRFNRANTTTIQDPFHYSRKRATSTAVKINRSVLEPSSLLDDSMTLPPSQLNISFQENERRDSISKTLFNIPTLISHVSTPAAPGRVRSQTMATKTRQPSIIESKDSRRKSIMPSPIREKSFNDKIKLQPIPSLVLNEPKKTGVGRQSRQNSVLRQVCGSTDILKKDRFVRFLEGSFKRISKMTEAPKKPQKESELKIKEIERLNKEIKSKKQADKGDRELRSESLDEVKELSREDKEDRRKDLAEFTFYKELNELIQFCSRENSIYIFLKAIKLLGMIYLTYEKLDEAFHCFCQLRWASEYLGMYKAKASAFFKMADCCKLLENYDDAIKLLRKSLQYSWEHNLINREMKIYDTLGKLYYLKGEIKKAQYYNERFASGISEPKDSPLREHYNQFLIDNREKGRYGHFTSIDATIMMRLSFPLLPSNLNRRNSQFSALSSFSAEDQRKKELDQRPMNVNTFQDQLLGVITDSELILHREAGMEGDEADDRQEGPEMLELPSPSFKVNLAELDPGKTNDQRLRELKLKEERLFSVIRNAKRELTDQDPEGDRKKSMHNIFELQIAFQREKRSILNQQQAYRIHLAKLWKSQYHVFESKRKPGVCKSNLKTESNIVMENKYDIDLEDPDFFQGLKKKIMALRFENNIPPFVLMTHKKMPKKPVKRDVTMLNENAKKIYLKFYKTIMKKIAPERVNKFSRDEAL